MNERIRPETAAALLTRVVERLSQKVSLLFFFVFFFFPHREQNVAPFNEAETSRLCGMFKVSETQLTAVVETCGYVFEQCAYFGAASGALAKELAALGLNADLGAAFVAVWDEAGASLRAALADRSICPRRLVESDWSMHLRLGQQDATRIKKPAVVLALTTRDQDADDVASTTVLEFSQAQLVDFSRQLDRIQAQLDALN